VRFAMLSNKVRSRVRFRFVVDGSDQADGKVCILSTMLSIIPCAFDHLNITNTTVIPGETP